MNNTDHPHGGEYPITNNTYTHNLYRWSRQVEGRKRGTIDLGLDNQGKKNEAT
jgi:ribosomal protein L2